MAKMLTTWRNYCARDKCGCTKLYELVVARDLWP